jgi:hypothetical protein
MGGVFSSRSKSYYIVTKQGISKYKRLGPKEGECEFLIPADESPSYEHKMSKYSDVEAALMSTGEHIIHILPSDMEKIASLVISSGGLYKDTIQCQTSKNCCQMTFSVEEPETVYPAIGSEVPSAPPPLAIHGCFKKITADQFRQLNFTRVSTFHLDPSDIGIIHDIEQNTQFNVVDDCEDGCLVMECKPALIAVE